jgi:hypothetical protein
MQKAELCQGLSVSGLSSFEGTDQAELWIEIFEINNSLMVYSPSEKLTFYTARI